MSILVTGADGMMGWGFKKVFNNLLLTNKSTLDVTNPVFPKKKPTIIFHLAAETDHHRAESNPEHTYMVNHTGTFNMVEYARKLDIPIVYVSTIGIFDGLAHSYNENDSLSPLNHYGKSKYYGELAVQTYEKYYIIRAGWGMGGGPLIDKKFINKIYQQIKEGKKFIYAINDVFGSPTYTPDFAKAVKKIISNAYYGTYHVAPPDNCSRYELAKEFIRLLGLEAKIEVISVSKKEYHSYFPQEVIYQNREVANTSKIQRLGIKVRSWRDALAEYVGEFR